MKQKFLVLCLFCATVIAFTGCAKDEEDVTGSIYGIVTDADNGEPIKSANVSLNPGGRSTVTGTDGRYEFLDLQPGQYTVQVVKSGYESNTKHITVEVGKTASGDMVLSKASSKLRLNTNTLNFGSGQTSLSFNISNIGTTGSINWSISSSLDWVQISPLSGTTATGKTSEVVVTLLRDQITGPVSGIITVIADGESLPVTISAGMPSSGDEDLDGSQDGDVSTGTFSGTVTGPRPGLDVQLTGVSKNNGVLTVNFTIQNNETFDIYQLAIRHNWDEQFAAYDNEGNTYNSTNVQELKLGNEVSAGYSFDVRLGLPQGVRLSCSLKIKGVPDTVTEFTNITLPCLYYNQSPAVTYDQKKIVFKNLTW